MTACCFMASDDDRVDHGEDEGEDAPSQAERLAAFRAQAAAQPPTPREGQTKKKGAKKLAPIRINLSGCKYEVLRIVQRKLGWREVGDDEDWEVYWTDTSVSIERIIRLTKIQKINHFNGMLEICRKKPMAKNLGKMAKLFPEHYDFFPRTFLLPNDIQELMADVKARGKKQIYIFKPDAGCQGRGIRLLQGGKEEAVLKLLKEMDHPNVVAQHYLTKPLLVNGYKFDMRIYALVLSCDPLRVFIFHEGLARFCTEKYCKPKSDNLHISFMHLTNYAVNKHNENFVAAQAQDGGADDASKWTLKQLSDHLKSQGHDWDRVWSRIQQLIVKSLASIQPVLKNNYRSVLPADNDGFSCFEILGYDIMLDSKLEPWLIEVNHSPSFNIDSPLDLAIKEQLIADTLQLVRVDAKLIAKAKKADKRAAAGRLLEPLQKKKLPPGATPAPATNPGVKPTGATPVPAGTVPGATPAPAGPGCNTPAGVATGTGTGSGLVSGASTPGGAAAAVVGDEQGGAGKPGKSWEEYEAIRAEALAKREKYEAKHSGGFTCIYPTSDKTLQGLYDELLRGASELFQSTFQAKAKRALENIGEERRKAKDETESESVRAEKARAKAHRDKLALMAAERRSKKAAEAVSQCVAGSTTTSCNPLAGYVPGPTGMLYLINSRHSSLSTSTRGLTGMEFVWGQNSQRSEVWGESEGCSSAGSVANSRPASARSADRPGLSHRLSSSLIHSVTNMSRLLPASVVAPTLDQAASTSGQSGSAGGVPAAASVIAQLIRAGSNKLSDGAAGNVLSSSVGGVDAQIGAGQGGGGSVRGGQQGAGSAAEATANKAGVAKGSGGGAASHQQRVVQSKEFSMWSSQALISSNAPKTGLQGSSTATSDKPSNTAQPASKGVGSVQSTSPQQQLLTSISMPSPSQGLTPLQHNRSAAVNPSNTAGSSPSVPSMSPTDSGDALQGSLVGSSQGNNRSGAGGPDRLYSAGLPRTPSQSALPGGGQGDAGGGLSSGASTRQVCPTFWRSASGNTRTVPLMLNRGIASSLSTATSLPQPPGKLATQQRPLSGNQHSFAMRMAAMTPPGGGAPGADAKLPGPTGPQLPSGLTGLQRAASNPLPAPLPFSSAHSFNLGVPFVDPASILGPTRPMGVTSGAVRPPSPTSIYIHGPPGIPSGPAAAGSGGSSYGGTLQFASEASYWPSATDKAQLGPTNSFVVRPVVVSSKAAPKGGTLYTSLRPSPSTDKVKQPVGNTSLGSQVLSVTGQRMQAQEGA